MQLIAWRGLYRGGVLHGGALLPVPTGASDVWQAYTAAWHPVTLGSDTMAHPSTAVLGAARHAAARSRHVGGAGACWWSARPLAGVLAYLVTRSFGLSHAAAAVGRSRRTR